MDEGMDELLGEFLVESFENLDQLDQDLISLEQHPGDIEVLKSIFRTIHTIKGTCGFLGFGKLEKITHVGENLLSLLRDEVAIVDQEIASALLSMTDAVRSILGEIEATQAEGDGDYSALVDVLGRLEQSARNGERTGDAAPASSADVPDATTGGVTFFGERDAVATASGGVEFFDNQPTASPAATSGVTFFDESESSVDDHTDIEAPEGARVGELLVQDGSVSEVDVAIGLIQQHDVGDSRPLGEILTEAKATTTDKVDKAVAQQAEVKSTVADSTLRVDVGLLDELMTLVGELVLARNQILQLAGGANADPVFTQTTQRLNVITTELQAGVMKTRMQPIGNVWSKFPRVVRDVATACGKKVRIEMEGKETELDKTIIEAIKDPLTHLIRNSIDHGIEKPDVRRERGKNEEGLVMLRAYHEGGQVNIEIVDDGGGVDVDRVKSKAVERGLITADQASKMSDREATNLIFLPGFSTAEQVSNISGRGVGMDVVRTNIERIGGALDVSNRPGEGTTIKVKIPLTLAIIPALIVTVGGEQFAIPQVSLLELVGLDGNDRVNSIENVHGAPVYRLRGNILPIVHLHEQLQVHPANDRDSVTIVVLRADDREFGLIVDEVNDTEEIVVKPLASQLKNMDTYSGCTIMGDGRVALILDVTGIAQMSNVLSAGTEHGGPEQHERNTEVASDAETLLVVQIGSDGRAALPLSLVDRLEEFPRTSIERAAGREVVQYRDSILPLLDVCGAVGFTPNYETDGDQVQVVVFSNGDRMVGLVVDRIVDIVHDRVTTEQPSSRYGMTGSTVLQGLVTDLLDVHSIIGASEPDFFTHAETTSDSGSYSYV